MQLDDRDIEALLSGCLSPSDELLAGMTLGRDRWLNRMRDHYLGNFIADGGSKVKMLAGSAGTGKTHLLRCILHDAHLHWLLNWAGTLSYPIYTLGVAASSLRNDVWFSGTTATTAKNDRTLIPDLAAEKYDPAAKTEMQAFFDKAISSHCPTIKPLQQQDVITLLTALVALHGAAYNWDAVLDIANLLRAIGNQPIRTYIRATLEALDMAYLYEEAPTLSVGNLTEFSVREDEGFFHLDEDQE